MPTPSPALKRLPRWRTMISPPLTAWPANVFTPRRLALESRPLRLDPSPFLCAILARLLRGLRAARGGLLRGRLLRGGVLRRGLFRRGGRRRFRGFARRAFDAAERDLGDLDPRELLAVAGAAFVAALGLELHDAQLLAALVAEDLRLDP